MARVVWAYYGDTSHPKKMKQTPTSSNELMIQTAHEAGCPIDQVQRLLGFGYIPLPWQWKFHAACREADAEDGPTAIGCGGARGPGKSHVTMAQVALDDSVRCPGLKTLFLRNTGKAARESFTDLMNRVLKGKIQFHFNRTDNILHLPGDSRIILGGYHTEADLDNYVGVEYDQIVIEEMTQLTSDKITPLLGSLRTSRNDWRPRMLASTNPGGIGHLHFKQMFIEPYRMKEEKNTRFIPSTYRDNPYLNKEYVKYLENLKGDLGLAWRDGEWDVFMGQAFPLFRDDIHIIEPFDIPSHWPRTVGIDWGYAAPFCALWVAKDPDTSRLYVYREVYQKQLTDAQQARLIRELSRDESIQAYYADPSMWTKRTTDVVARSTADVYAEEGIALVKADNDRLSGKRKVDRLLGLLPDGEPGILIFNTCRNFRRTFPALPHSKVNVEDVDTRSEDHLYDSLRYNLTNVTQRVRQRNRIAQVNPLERIKYIG